MPSRLEEVSSLFLFVVDQLRSRFMPKGLDVMVQSTGVLQGKLRRAGLEKLTAPYPRTLWLLQKASPLARQSFADRGPPFIVLGSGMPGIAYLDIDHAAVTRASSSFRISCRGSRFAGKANEMADLSCRAA